MLIDGAGAAYPAQQQPVRGMGRMRIWILPFLVVTMWAGSYSFGQVHAGSFSSGNQSVTQKLSVAANSGDANAQVELGRMFFQARQGSERHQEAARWFRAASDQGSTEAAAWLGACYLFGRGVPKDEQKARALLEPAASLGNATGLRFLGVLYERSEDYDKAAGFYAQAVQKGDDKSLIRLARLNAHGLGMAKDKKKGGALLMQAAAQGGEWAQLRLGEIYERGRRKAGIAKDPAIAAQLYSGAAAQGNRIAAYRLGRLYKVGAGTAVPADPNKALTYFKQSALAGYAPAQYELAQMRELAQGVKGSSVAAYYWYSMAQRRGNELASVRLLSLRGKMSAEDVQKAEDLLRQHDLARGTAIKE